MISRTARAKTVAHGGPNECSGLMYAAVPTMAPVLVRCSLVAVRAMPKSTRTVRPAGVDMMLRAFGSQWMAQAFCHLNHDGNDLVRRHRPALTQQLRQRVPFLELHDDERRAPMRRQVFFVVVVHPCPPEPVMPPSSYRFFTTSPTDAPSSADMTSPRR